ncbi:Two pore potassium channel protein sup-9 [Trichinella sp. T8]|nr:Two pore potassium channel protein sup-9 [Trichinella sp. T8]
MQTRAPCRQYWLEWQTRVLLIVRSIVEGVAVVFHDREACCKTHQRKNIRAFSLIVCTLGYLMFGAAVFDALESETDNRKLQLLQELMSRLRHKYNFTDDDFRVLQTVIIRSIPHKAGYQWKFAGAFYFATVVITTVGYGHSTPATKLGKVFCMFYALCGIPLNLVMFQCIGERLNTLIAYVLYKVRKFLKFNQHQVTHTQMILVSTTLGTMVIMSGAYLFHKYENWTFFEGFYYCFITLTTIGFGDYVAIQKNYALEKHFDYIVLSLLFMLFGLALFSASVNLFVLRFMASKSDLESRKVAALLPALPALQYTRKSYQNQGSHRISSRRLSPLITLSGFSFRRRSQSEGDEYNLRALDWQQHPESPWHKQREAVQLAWSDLNTVDRSVSHVTFNNLPTVFVSNAEHAGNKKHFYLNNFNSTQQTANSTSNCRFKSISTV